MLRVRRRESGHRALGTLPSTARRYPSPNLIAPHRVAHRTAPHRAVRRHTKRRPTSKTSPRHPRQARAAAESARLSALLLEQQREAQLAKAKWDAALQALQQTVNLAFQDTLTKELS